LIWWRGERKLARLGEIFSDSMMAAAILDRFLFRATLVSINGDSYRMRAHRERLQMLRAGMGPSTSRMDGPTQCGSPAPGPR